MLCILGNGRPRALLWIQITNRQEPRCFGERHICWYHLHTYVNEVAYAYMREKHIYVDAKTDTLNCNCKSANVWSDGCAAYIYEPQKYANAKVTLRRICTFRGWSFLSGKPHPLVVWSEFAYNLYELASMARKMN